MIIPVSHQQDHLITYSAYSYWTYTFLFSSKIFFLLLNTRTKLDNIDYVTFHINNITHSMYSFNQ